MKALLLLAAAITLMAAPAIARADVIGITGFSGGSAFPSFNGTPDTIGYRFTPTVAISVTQLGMFDPTAYGHPLTQSHDVGLWDSSGNLLASVVVAASGLEVNSFYYDSITPVALTANATYTIGAYFPTANGDVYVSGASSVTPSADITFNGAAVITGGSSLSDPTTTSGANGRFGPNFQYVEGTVGVPEPTAMLIFGSGLLALRITRRRRG